MTRHAEIKRLIEEKKKPREIADYLEDKYFESVDKWDGEGGVPKYAFVTPDITLRDMAAKLLHERGYNCKISSFREDGYPMHRLEFHA